ncbi:MAG: hypothetical protein WCJ39_04460 [bacterium]
MQGVKERLLEVFGDMSKETPERINTITIDNLQRIQNLLKECSLEERLMWLKEILGISSFSKENLIYIQRNKREVFERYFVNKNHTTSKEKNADMRDWLARIRKAEDPLDSSEDKEIIQIMKEVVLANIDAVYSATIRMIEENKAAQDYIDTKLANMNIQKTTPKNQRKSYVPSSTQELKFQEYKQEKAIQETKKKIQEKIDKIASHLASPSIQITISAKESISDIELMYESFLNEEQTLQLAELKKKIEDLMKKFQAMMQSPPKTPKTHQDIISSSSPLSIKPDDIKNISPRKGTLDPFA